MIIYRSTILLTAVSHDDDDSGDSLDFMALTNDTGDIEIHWLKSTEKFSKLADGKKLLKILEN